VPAAPLGVVSPVDGQVIEVDVADKGVLQGEAHRIRIRIDALGTYTARAPIEGKILDLRSVNDERVAEYQTNALWLQTDEGDDVVLQFSGYRLGLAPRSFVRFGERVGQGQRCAYLRLARYAELHLPIESKVLVQPGQMLTAGSDLIGKVPHP
jgi:phosphatidylserine decarboxylase